MVDPRHDSDFTIKVTLILDRICEPGALYDLNCIPRSGTSLHASMNGGKRSATKFRTLVILCPDTLLDGMRVATKVAVKPTIVVIGGARCGRAER